MNILLGVLYVCVCWWLDPGGRLKHRSSVSRTKVKIRDGKNRIESRLLLIRYEYSKSTPLPRTAAIVRKRRRARASSRTIPTEPLRIAWNKGNEQRVQLSMIKFALTGAFLCVRETGIKRKKETDVKQRRRWIPIKITCVNKMYLHFSASSHFRA